MNQSPKAHYEFIFKPKQSKSWKERQNKEYCFYLQALEQEQIPTYKNTVWSSFTYKWLPHPKLLWVEIDLISCFYPGAK